MKAEVEASCSLDGDGDELQQCEGGGDGGGGHGSCGGGYGGCIRCDNNACGGRGFAMDIRLQLHRLGWCRRPFLHWRLPWYVPPFTPFIAGLRSQTLIAQNHNPKCPKITIPNVYVMHIWRGVTGYFIDDCANLEPDS